MNTAHSSGLDMAALSGTCPELGVTALSRVGGGVPLNRADHDGSP